MLINVKVRYSKCEGYEYYNYQCPSESQHVRTVPSNNVDNSNIVEDIHVSSKTASVIEDISLVLAYRLLIEVHMSSNSTIDDVNKIIEPNTP